MRTSVGSRFEKLFRGLCFAVGEVTSVEGMTTEAHSLVEWVNSFSEGTCETLTELSSGSLLLKCMKNVIPNLSSETGQEWTSLSKALTEFCGCSLEQSVDRELIQSGNEEHLARAVVLLLCLAVQRKPNEDVISRITTLPYKAQCDIMYFIEEALAKINSNALSSGLFTSGVGDVVPAFPERTEASTREEEDDGRMEHEEKSSDDEAGCDGCDSTPQPTPNRLKSSSRSNLFACPSSIPRSVSRRHISRTSAYYRGLESPAAVQWMQSQRRPVAQTPANGSSEELLRLQHKVRVLEKSLQNEQTLSQEMHAALCQREQEYRELESSHQKAQVMAEKARELSDVQDELETTTKALEKSQKSLQRFQREVEEQQMCRDRELEEKLSAISHLETENTQLKELLEKAVADQLEQKSEVKRLQLSSETASITFQAKQREYDTLLQLNQEYSSEISNLKQQCASLQQDLTRHEEDSNEKEKLLTDENQILSLKVAQIQEELSEMRDKGKELAGECELAKQQVTVAEAGCRAVLERYQTAVGEMEALRTQCRLVEGSLQEARVRQQSLQTELQESNTELSHLRNQLTDLRRTTEEECENFKQRLIERETELLGLQQTSAEKIKVLEEQLLAAGRELVVKEEEVCEVQKRLSEEVRALQESLDTLREQLEVKERELSSLTRTAAEQRQQMEGVLLDTHEKLNTLTEKYTTEAEEMAAVKASLEEDLVRANSELREIRATLSEKKRLLSEREGEAESARNENEALGKEIQSLRGAVEEQGRERERAREERDRFENELQDATALMEVKEQRWLAERSVLESSVVELSSKLETATEAVTQSLREAEQGRERQQTEWERERGGWLVQTALLEEELKNVTEELESSTATTNELKREAEGLRGEADKTQSFAHSLQAEVTAKSSALVALEHTLSETRMEGDRTRREAARTEEVLTARVDTLMRQLAEVDRERERVQKEFEHLSQESQNSLAKIETKYQSMLAKKEMDHQTHCTELDTLREANTLLQQQQAEAKAENTAILQRQSELYKDYCTLQETKSESMDLCRQYESAYNEERERRRADREQIRKMRSQSVSESESAANEAHTLRKQLSVEKRTTTRIGAENKSLKAQVSFLEQKLRDMERERELSSPLKSWRGPRTTYIVPPPPHHSKSTRPNPQQNSKEFYSHLQHEFDATTSTQIPTEISLAQSHDAFNSQASEMTLNGSIFPGPQYHSTTVKQSPHNHQHDTYNTTRSHSALVSQESKEGDGDRVSELKHRNLHVLPHLKSYYAVEMQQKFEDPCIVSEGSSRPQRKRAVGANTSIRVASLSSKAVEDSLFMETRKRTTTSRKVAGDLSFSSSPAPSRRRISEPLTPQQTPSTLPPESYSWRQDPGRTTMAPGYSLREYLNGEEENRGGPEVGNTPATMFEMKFSPPHSRALRELPERLRQRLSKQEKNPKPPPDMSGVTATGGKKEPSVHIRKRTQKQTSKRPVLKTKN